MELLVRRGQQDNGFFGTKMVFTLFAQAKLTDEEKANVSKYKLGTSTLYNDIAEGHGDDVKVSGQKYAYVSANALVEGVSVQCKSVAILLDVEARLVEASQGFKRYLDVAASFGGEQVYQFE